MSKKTEFITKAGLIAAIYVVLSFAQALIAPTTVFSAIQLRISETLMMLCLYSPASILGLTVGCMIVNIANSPIDIVLGGLATFISGILMYLFKDIRFFKLPILSAVIPAFINGFIISFEINFFFTEVFTLTGFLLSFLSVFAGEFIVLYVIGLPFVKIFEKRGFDKKFIDFK